MGEILTDRVGDVEFAVVQCLVHIAASSFGATACPELATTTPDTLTVHEPHQQPPEECREADRCI